MGWTLLIKTAESRLISLLTLFGVMAVNACWSFPLSARSSFTKSYPAQLEHQVEAGFNLSAHAAISILQSYDFVPQLRNDYYVDAYDGERFLLIPHPIGYKFRLKAYEKKWILQATRKLAYHQYQCSSELALTIKEKEMGELSLSRRAMERFSQQVSRQLNQFHGSDIIEVANEIREFHQFVLDLKVPLLKELSEVPSQQTWYFTASHLTKKTKWKTKVDVGYGNMEVSITDGRDFLGDHFFQRKFEVEFQTLENMPLQTFAQSICLFMSKQKLSIEDINPFQNDPQEETLAQLRKFNSPLGFK